MDDAVSEKILLSLAKYVVFTSVKDFSLDVLNILYSRFTHVEAKASDPTDKVFELLLEWKHKGVRVLRDVLSVTVEGISKGYVDAECLEVICAQANISQEDQCVKDICAKLNACDIVYKRENRPLVTNQNKGFSNIRKWTEQSFNSPPFNIAVQTEWLSTPRKARLKDIYTNLRWVHIHRKPCDVLRRDIDGYWKVLTDTDLGDGPVRILVEGNAGIGKTTFVHLLAIEWATKARPELGQFHFVFVIPLRDVKPHHTLEELIVNCHKRLAHHKVEHESIGEILQEDTGRKVLLILDGYDEYIPGMNSSIDNALEKLSLWDCWIIITSRPSDKLNKIRQFIDAEARILGFTQDNVTDYASKLLGEEDAEKLVAKARAREMMDILTIPIMLQMVCELYASGRDLPQTKLDIIRSIFNFCFDRATQKTGEIWSEETKDEVLYNLGMLSWEALTKEARQLILNKRQVVETVGAGVLETGLLMVTDDEDGGLTFQHKMLQEYAASYFLHKRHGHESAQLTQMFPNLRSIVDFNVVLQFLCGQSEEMSKAVVESCSQIVAKSFIDNLGRAQSLFTVDWLIDERAYLTGINKIIDPHIVLSWSDAVGIYLQTIFETLASIHREGVRTSKVKSFDCKDLWVLSPDAWSLPCDPPNPDQKLVIVHHLDKVTANTYLSLVGATEYQQVYDHNTDVDQDHEQRVMLIGPQEEYSAVVPCMSQVVACLGALNTVFLCRFVFEKVSNGNLDALWDLSKSLFHRKTLEHIIILKSMLPEAFYSEMFTSVKNNRDLQKLDIYFCEIPSGAARLIPDALSSLTKLTSLTLRQCNFNLADSERICQQMFHLVSLQHLDLCLNPSIGQCADILAETFEKWKDHPLEEIYVRECHIPGNKGGIFLKAVTNLPNMRKMGLACNNLQGALPGLMANPPPLEELYIWRTGIETGDLLSIAAAVQAKKLSHLRRLHIEQNGLTNAQVEPLLTQLNVKQNTEILLDVSNNNLSKDFISHWSSIAKRHLSICWHLE